MKQILQFGLLFILLIGNVTAASVMTVSCDTLEGTDEFSEGDSLCVYGSGFEAGEDVDLYVVENSDDYTDNMELTDVTQEVETVTVTSQGVLVLKKIWNFIVQGVYDIVADINNDGKYNSGDVVNSASAAGVTVNEGSPTTNGEDLAGEVPEWSTIGSLLVLAIAGLFIYKNRGDSL